MKNRIRIARGTAKRLRELNNASNLPAGVPLFTTDDKKLHIGDDNTLPKNVLGINATGAEKLVSFDYSGDQAVQSDVEVGDTSYPVYFEDGIPKQCANVNKKVLDKSIFVTYYSPINTTNCHKGGVKNA